MLIEIQCDKFISNGAVRPAIRFHEGLNAVVGDANRSNSIGKSTFLMILDFVFGGKDYITKCADVQTNVGEHNINFSFKFNGVEYYFSRNTVNHRVIMVCDESYVPLENVKPWSLDDYCDFLAEKYKSEVEGLSWRGTVSRFIRVYRRETMDAERPLKSAKDEKTEKAIESFMRLYGKYESVAVQIARANQAEDEFETFKKSERMKIIRRAQNQKEYDANEAKIATLKAQEIQLADESNKGLLDMNSVQAQHLSELNDQLLQYRRQYARVQHQLNTIRREMVGERKSLSRSYEELKRFFPNEEFRALEEVEHFHQQLRTVLHDEFKDTEKTLATAYIMLNNEIVRVKKEIAELNTVPNVTEAVLKEFARLTTEINNLEQANSKFKEYEKYQEDAKEYAETRDAVISAQLRAIEKSVNTEMEKITERLYGDDQHVSPEISISSLKKTSFSTPNDGGSGAQTRGLITFDIANMNITPLPFIVHDADLLDPIEKNTQVGLIKEYDVEKKDGKQVFASFRSLEFYSPEAAELIKETSVLNLSSGGNELFGRAWNRKAEEEIVDENN